MNLYDFDKTIYAKDSSIEFLLFALKNKTLLVLPNFLKFTLIYLLYKMNVVSKIKVKEAMFSFLPKIKNPEHFLAEFWCDKKLDDWYLKQQDSTDIIISASPRFLITPILNQNKIKRIIASELDPKTGLFLSKNCYGEEKVVRFKKQYPKAKVNSAYSDSISDMPMLNLAKNKYLVLRKKHSVQIKNIDTIN